jgi:hypothetical protein
MRAEEWPAASLAGLRNMAERPTLDYASPPGPDAPRPAWHRAVDELSVTVPIGGVVVLVLGRGSWGALALAGGLLLAGGVLGALRVAVARPGGRLRALGVVVLVYAICALAVVGVLA